MTRRKGKTPLVWGENFGPEGPRAKTAPRDPKACCANCVYALAGDQGQGLVMFCRRYPPQLLSFDIIKDIASGRSVNQIFNSHFPPMTPKGWCGEWIEGEPEIMTEDPPGKPNVPAIQ